MSVLNVVFPDVVVLLCQFHVLKYLREEISSAEYGFTSWQKQQLHGIMSLLVYARTEHEFTKYRNYMRHVMSIGRGGVSRSSGAGPNWGHLVTESSELVTESSELGTEISELGTVGNSLGVRTGLGMDSELRGVECGDRDDDLSKHPFEIYFAKNWDTCRSMWCFFERQNAVTMGNNTNNRLEASWKQLKDLVDSFMGVDECIASIMCYQSQQEKKFVDDVYKLSVVHNIKYDAEMQFVSNLVSEHACELIYEQYIYATTKGKYKYYEPVPDVYLLQHDCDDEDALDEPSSEYSITKRDWSCSCLFMCSRLLPCRHIFFLRKVLGCENNIPTQQLNPRWLLASLRMTTDFPEFCGESFAVFRVMQEPNTVWDSNRKFREANSVASTITEHLSGLGMREYQTAMKVLREVATLFKHGEYNAIASHQSVPSGTACTDSEAIHESPDGGLITSLTADDSRANSCIDAGSFEISPANATVDSTGDEVDTTQVGIQLGTNLDSGAPQLGSGTDQLGAGTDRIGMSCDRLTTQTDQVQESTQVYTPFEANTAQGRSVNLEDSNDSFEIQSPPKPRWWPKQKPKAVKAKRNLAITMVQEDLDMHENKLHLLALYEILDGAPTYNSSHKKLTQFSLFKFLTKPKPPIAYEIAKLPASKPLMRPEDISRVFSMDLIKKCMAKVSAYQKKHAGVRELDIPLEIVGLGVFANSTIALMKKWHRAHETLKKIDSTMNWLKQLDFSRLNASTYSIEDDPELPEKRKAIPLFSAQAQVLDLTAKECLSYEIMHLVFSKRFGLNRNVTIFDSETLGVVVDGKILADHETIRRNLAGVSKEVILFPVNSNGNHWCSVMMNLEKRSVAIYDSSSSSYLISVRAVAQTLIMLLPQLARPRPRVHTYESGLGVQVDSYNCGVYVLLAFEVFCGGEPLGHLDKKSLQCLRYRYLHMCMQA